MLTAVCWLPQQGNLGRDDVEIAVDAQPVALDGQIEVLLRGLDGDILLRDFSGENPQGGEIVFHLLEGRQARFAGNWPRWRGSWPRLAR
jgi:hypothetical protein